MSNTVWLNKNKSSFVGDDLGNYTSFIEDIDSVVFEWLDKKMNIRTTTNDGFSKVPVVWANSDRAYYSKKLDHLKRQGGDLIYPLISVNATEVKKPEQGFWQGGYKSDGKNDTPFTIAKKLEPVKTSQFKEKAPSPVKFSLEKDYSKRTPVYTYVKIPLPINIEINYKISIRVEYKTQLNEIFEQLILKSGALSGRINAVAITKENNFYELFLENLMNFAVEYSESTRLYNADFKINAKGYLIASHDSPDSTTAENFVKARIKSLLKDDTL